LRPFNIGKGGNAAVEDNRTPRSISLFELPPDQFWGLVLFFVFGAMVWVVNLVVQLGPVGAVKTIMEILR
jgi:hypothetical protein